MLIQKLLQEKMKMEGLSLRDAARASKVSHTTIRRIIKGETHELDLTTITKLAEWLNVPIWHLMGGDDKTLNQIATIVSLEPRLSEVFELAYYLFSRGEISLGDLSEIANYAEYKLRDKYVTEEPSTLSNRSNNGGGKR